MCPSDGSFVVGPMDPATYPRPPCRAMAARACSTAARLISSTRPSSPYSARTTELAPKVFVSRTIAPAARNDPCSSAMASGAERFRYSLHPSCFPQADGGRERRCRFVPHAPSKMRTVSSKRPTNPPLVAFPATAGAEQVSASYYKGNPLLSNRRPFGLTSAGIPCYLRTELCIRYTIFGPRSRLIRFDTASDGAISWPARFLGYVMTVPGVFPHHAKGGLRHGTSGGKDDVERKTVREDSGPPTPHHQARQGIRKGDHRPGHRRAVHRRGAGRPNPRDRHLLPGSP